MLKVNELNERLTTCTTKIHCAIWRILEISFLFDGIVKTLIQLITNKSNSKYVRNPQIAQNDHQLYRPFHYRHAHTQVTKLDLHFHTNSFLFLVHEMFVTTIAYHTNYV